MNSIKNIYCFSGLGADEKVFANISLPGYNLIHPAYIKPTKKETLQSYAGRMAKQIEEQAPIILGLSFGGMLAIEMAKQIPVKKIILISTVKTRNEIPAWMRITGTLRLHKYLPVQSNRFSEKSDDRRIGIQSREEKELVEYYRKTADTSYLNWGIDQILNWKNNWIPDGICHIHGENDRMFPLKNIKATHVISGGTHIMILNKAGEISQCIQEILREI